MIDLCSFIVMLCVKVFSKLRYPNTLVNSIIRRFMQETDRAPHAVTSSEPSVYIKLPFKDQRSADRVRNEINSLGTMINVNVKPVFTSRKLSQTLSVKEKKPPIVNTQCVVYSFQCDLCDANYVGFTARHLHQRIREHHYSAIGKHLDFLIKCFSKSLLLHTLLSALI